jgi:toxin ParE1/3/4
MKIKWLRKSINNLEKIAQYIQQDNPSASLNVITKIQVSVNKLSEFPLMGRKGRIEGTRELIITNSPYIVVYRVQADRIEILRILHSSQKFPT